MSNLDQLSDELIVKLFLCLKGDSKSTRNLIMTCHRFCTIANNRLTKNKEWLHSRTLVLYINPLYGRKFEYDCKPAKFIPFTTMVLANYSTTELSRERLEHIFSIPRLDLIVDFDLFYSIINYDELFEDFLKRLPRLLHLSVLYSRIDNIPKSGRPNPFICFETTSVRTCNCEGKTFLNLLGKLSFRILVLTGFRLLILYLSDEVTKHLRNKRHIAKKVILDESWIGGEQLLAVANNPDLQHLQILVDKCFKPTDGSIAIFDTTRLNNDIASKYLDIERQLSSYLTKLASYPVRFCDHCEKYEYG